MVCLYEEDNVGFIPRANETSVKIPITIDNQEGRKERYKNRWIWACVALVIIIAMSVGMLINGEQPFFNRVIMSFLFFSISTLVLRFGYLREGKIRNRMVEGIDNDYEVSTEAFWGITRISDQKPYICRFPNNQTGVFVRMTKGVFKGDLAESKHRHRKAIADFYKMVGDKANAKTVLSVTHIDLMDYVGTDDRIDRARNSIAYTDNELLKQEIQGVYDNLKRRASQMVFTSDIFVFKWSGQSNIFLDMIREGLARMLQGGGYTSYEYLDENDLHDLYCTIFNVADFSVAQARREAIKITNDHFIKPIKVYYKDGGYRVLNYTREQKQAQEAYNRAHREAEKRRKKDHDFETENLGVEKPAFASKGYNGRIEIKTEELENDDIESFKF